MWQGCPNDQAADWMADKADLAYAGDGAEWKDVLLDLCGKSLSHLHDISFGLVLVRLRKQDHSVWMLQRYLVLEESHIVVVSLKAMGHDKQVNPYEVTFNGNLIVLGDLIDLAFTDLVSILDLFNEGFVFVDTVALLEDDGADLGQWLLHSFSLDLELGSSYFFGAVWFHVQHALLNRFAFYPRQVLVSLSDVLISVSWEQSEVTRRDHFSEDWLCPLLAGLVLVLNLEIFGDEAWGRFYDLDDLVLQDEQLTRDDVDLEKHLVCHCVYIAMVDPDTSVEQASWKW